MGYLFVTGGTGLLGAYLVRDLLSMGTNLALLVRSTKKESARRRVENLVARWESQEQKPLPRPVVVEGDLGADNLGLDERGLEWVARHCDSVLHNAASLTFHALSPDDEPWRSNLHGTRRVLELCRGLSIRKLHYVSTAYVCGERRGRVFESELDAGQTHGNDYETSKFQAELMVRGADFLDAPTIYRPGIIIGDSRTGYTSTFHGFYVPLKLLSSLLKRAAGLASTREELQACVDFGGKRLTEIVNLSDRERKNYVPVDWVSSVMAHVISHPEHHGKTYHLTPSEPVSLKLTRQVMEDAFLKYTELAPEKTVHEAEWSDVEKLFIEGMKIYESYWRDDPVFDTSNVQAAAPHLPCPPLDAELFMRMCRYAIETNFGRLGERKPPSLAFDVQQTMSRWEALASTASGNGNGRVPGKRAYLGLRVDGSGGGQWELALADGRLVSADPGLSDRCSAAFHLNSQTFASLATETSTASEALAAGRIRIHGNGIPVAQMVGALQQAAVGMP